MEETEKLRAENQKLLKEKKELQTALTKQEFDDKILHRQWKEVNELVSVKEEELEQLKLQLARPKLSVPAVMGLMLAAMLAGGFVTYFVVPARTPGELLLNTDSIPAAIDSTPRATNKKEGSGAGKLPVEKDKGKRRRKLVTEDPPQEAGSNQYPQKQDENTTVAFGSSDPAATGNQPNLGEYKVLAKAYFHDSPDEHSRRKAFIVHWNNAVLKPIGESGNFVYVVFTNHLGQTSQGWLDKNDLVKIE